jgi:hypothetical protein
VLGALDADAGAEIVFVPKLVGLGIGALASQFGSVTVWSSIAACNPRSARDRRPVPRAAHPDEATGSNLAA